MPAKKRLARASLALLCSALPLTGVSAQPPPDPAQLERGSELFYRRCSVCHGKTGLGFEEAREAFPESHRRCTQCHKSGGPNVMVIPFQDNNMFDVGHPPALRGPGTLRAWPDAAALRAYIQAAMPRHAPGSLSPTEATAITAFLTKLRAVAPTPKPDTPEPDAPVLPLD
jgi:cytochrome c